MISGKRGMSKQHGRKYMGVTGFNLKRSKMKTRFGLPVTIFLFLGIIAFPAAANVTAWEISPQNPNVGDTLIISGTASPEEEVGISISFDKTVPVYLRKYTYEFDNIEVLNFNSFFTVRAEGVEKLNMKTKIFLPKIKSARAENGLATISSSGLPPGEYKVRVKGIAEDGVSVVKLKITSLQKLNSGEDGKFGYRYNTESIPSEVLKIKIGDTEKQVTLKPKINKLSLQPPALSEPQILSLNPETSEVEVLTSTSHGEEGKIYLAQRPRNEDSSLQDTAGEFVSKESIIENRIQEQNNKINFFYLLAGVLVGTGFYLSIRRGR